MEALRANAKSYAKQVTGPRHINGSQNGSQNGNRSHNGSSNDSFSAGRLAKPLSALVQKHQEQSQLDWEVKNLTFVLRVDEAHTVMLAEQGLITEYQASAILGVIDQLKAAGPAEFVTKPGYGTIVLQVERFLEKHIGEDIAGRLSIARSRLDQGATVRRLVDRNGVLEVANHLAELLATLVDVADRHKDVPTISYTHLQQAQPANFGHYLLAFEDRLGETFSQLTQVYDRIDRCPLGAVGLSGTNLPTNRHRTAALLGFSQILDNSRRGRDAYYQIELACILAMIMTILNDLCTDMHVFSSAEFGMIETDDCHCGTSSIFPQKKNPFALEVVKKVAQESAGWVATALATFRNEGTGDTANRSLGALGDACNKTSDMLQLTSEILNLMVVKRDRCEALLKNTWVTTNFLANTLLLNHGMSYRTAHSVVARLVKNSLDNRIPRADVTIDMLREAAEEMGVHGVQVSKDELRAALDPFEYIRQSSSFGSVGPEQVKRLLTSSRGKVVAHCLWLDSKEKYLESANSELRTVTERPRVHKAA